MTYAPAGIGRTYRRGDNGYEAARHDTMWNRQVPDRFPDLIVQANTDADVVAAMKLAVQEGMRVGVRSGGHSWSGNHVREGGMLLDLSRMTSVEIDRPALRAVVGPGVRGDRLISILMKQGLFFPVGHCTGVSLGGYLLQGGFGWNGRALGPACESVLGIDYVDSTGEIRHASQTEDPEMLWAARGAGPGFFGVVLRYHLRLYPKPKYIGLTAAVYTIDRLEEVFRWVHAAGPDIPESVELNIVASLRATVIRKPGIEVLAPVFADSRAEARRDTRFMATRPRGARVVIPLFRPPFKAMFRGVMTHYPNDTNWAVDNMWTHATIDDLLPALNRMAETMPPARGHRPA